MGDAQKAAAALAHMPRWVAVHECTLAKVEAVFAVAMSAGFDLDDIWDGILEATNERDKAIGHDPFADVPTEAGGGAK